VTDYTTSGAFCSRPPGASWAAKLDKWVFKVSCRGGIERQAETIPVGSLCLLKNVIIKQTNTDRKLFGELGGEEMLISTANENAEQTIALSAYVEMKYNLWSRPSCIPLAEERSGKNWFGPLLHWSYLGLRAVFRSPKYWKQGM
jgi:hypothetical protein